MPRNGWPRHQRRNLARDAINLHYPGWQRHEFRAWNEFIAQTARVRVSAYPATTNKSSCACANPSGTSNSHARILAAARPPRHRPDQAAFSSARYRYSVARLTPRYLAMSLAVWPSAFIRFAVAMCSASSTLRGRPNLVPLARDALFQRRSLPDEFALVLRERP